MLNETHDPQLRSWLDSANEVTTDFPIQNLPFGVFRRAGSGEQFRGGVAIGDQSLDLEAAARSASPVAAAVGAAAAAPLNAFRRRPSTRCRPTSATTPTFTARSTTPPRSAACSVPINR
jgi:fumarylacetoacetase